MERFSVVKQLRRIHGVLSGNVVVAKDVQSANLVQVYEYSMDDEQAKRAAVKLATLHKHLTHENLQQIQTVFKSKTNYYLVFEHIPDTVSSLLPSTPGGFNTKFIQRATWQLLQALDFLHGLKITHRNVRPDAIAITRQAAVKLCGLELCRPAARPGAFTPRPGSMTYQPPEQLIGDVYGMPSDMWALGCLLLEMATGRPLFTGASEADVLTVILRTCGSSSLTNRQLSVIKGGPLMAAVRMPSEQEEQLGSLDKRFGGRVDRSVLALAKSCLQMDPAKRPTAKQLLAHAFFNELRPAQQQAPPPAAPPDMSDWQKLFTQHALNEVRASAAVARADAQAPNANPEDFGAPYVPPPELLAAMQAAPGARRRSMVLDGMLAPAGQDPGATSFKRRFGSADGEEEFFAAAARRASRVDGVADALEAAERALSVSTAETYDVLANPNAEPDGVDEALVDPDAMERVFLWLTTTNWEEAGCILGLPQPPPYRSSASRGGSALYEEASGGARALWHTSSGGTRTGGWASTWTLGHGASPRVASAFTLQRLSHESAGLGGNLEEEAARQQQQLQLLLARTSTGSLFQGLHHPHSSNSGNIQGLQLPHSGNGNSGSLFPQQQPPPPPSGIVQHVQLHRVSEASLFQQANGSNGGIIQDMQLHSNSDSLFPQPPPQQQQEPPPTRPTSAFVSDRLADALAALAAGTPFVEPRAPAAAAPIAPLAASLFPLKDPLPRPKSTGAAVDAWFAAALGSASSHTSLPESGYTPPPLPTALHPISSTSLAPSPPPGAPGGGGSTRPTPSASSSSLNKQQQSGATASGSATSLRTSGSSPGIAAAPGAELPPRPPPPPGMRASIGSGLTDHQQRVMAAAGSAAGSGSAAPGAATEVAGGGVERSRAPGLGKTVSFAQHVGGDDGRDRSAAAAAAAAVLAVDAAASGSASAEELQRQQVRQLADALLARASFGARSSASQDQQPAAGDQPPTTSPVVSREVSADGGAPAQQPQQQQAQAQQVTLKLSLDPSPPPYQTFVSPSGRRLQGQTSLGARGAGGQPLAGLQPQPPAQAPADSGDLSLSAHVARRTSSTGGAALGQPDATGGSQGPAPNHEQLPLSASLPRRISSTGTATALVSGSGAALTGRISGSGAASAGRVSNSGAAPAGRISGSGAVQDAPAALRLTVPGPGSGGAPPVPGSPPGPASPSSPALLRSAARPLSGTRRVLGSTLSGNGAAASVGVPGGAPGGILSISANGPLTALSGGSAAAAGPGRLSGISTSSSVPSSLSAMRMSTSSLTALPASNSPSSSGLRQDVALVPSAPAATGTGAPSAAPGGTPGVRQPVMGVLSAAPPKLRAAAAASALPGGSAAPATPARPRTATAEAISKSAAAILERLASARAARPTTASARRPPMPGTPTEQPVAAAGGADAGLLAGKLPAGIGDNGAATPRAKAAAVGAESAAPAAAAAGAAPASKAVSGTAAALLAKLTSLAAAAKT